MNTGAPMKAVITPMGISCGAKAVRATVSARFRKHPPASAEATTSQRCAVPTTRRMMWGMMSPTKPTSPDTDTTPSERA